MLQQFTWQQFLTAALILSLLWYAGVILICYRKELSGFFSPKSKPAPLEKLKPEWEEELYEEETEVNLMGKQAAQEGVSSASMEDLRFIPTREEIADNDKDAQLGLVSDVLEELKSIFHILEKENGGTEEFISLFALVKAKYPKIRESRNLEAITAYIREHLPFELNEEDLRKLWE